MREGWTYKKLGEVATFINGDRGKNYPSQKDFVDNGIPFINAGHIMNGEIDFDSMNYITEKKYNSLNSGKVIDGDILFCLRGSLGKKAIVKGVTQGAIASSLVIIRCNDVYNQYLFHYLNSSFISSCIYKSNNGSSQPNLSATSVSGYIIPIPPLSEQHSIVAELDMINELISLKKAQLSDLDSLAQSIFYDMFGDPIENEKGWEVKKLGEVCDVRDGTHDSPQYLSESEYFLITSKNIQGDIIDYANVNYISKEDYDSINKRSYVDEGDIIMGMIGTIGKPIIVHKNNLKFCVKNVALIKFPESCLVKNVYVKALLDNDSYKQYLLSLNKGGTQKFVALGTLRTLKCPLPPLSLQQDFAKRIELIEQQKAQISSTIKDLETLLASRMQHWFD